MILIHAELRTFAPFYGRINFIPVVRLGKQEIWNSFREDEGSLSLSWIRNPGRSKLLVESRLTHDPVPGLVLAPDRPSRIRQC